MCNTIQMFKRFCLRIKYLVNNVIYAAAQRQCAGARWNLLQFWTFVRPHKIFVRPQRLSVGFFWFVRPHREFVRSHEVLRQIFS